MEAERQTKQFARELKSSRDNLEQQSDVQLEDLWAAAKKNFYEKTGKDIDDSNFDTQMSENVRNILFVEATKAENTDQEEFHSHFSRANVKKAFSNAKRIFSTVFKVIWKFADFFMPMATSIPFVGSGVTLLTKAIEILIDTTKEYREIFAKAAELFEQVGFFSMRFEMLMEAEKAGAKVHRKFVIDCVALFVAITEESKRKAGSHKDRVKFAASVTTQFLKTMATNDDKGVGQHLDKLRSLVEEENKLSSALVLATVLQIQTDVVAVRGGVNTISAQLHTMRDMIGPSKIDQLKKLLHIESETWNTRFLACADTRVDGTGEWLMQHELLMSWISASANSAQVLAIEGASNAGKTFLAIAAIDSLRKHAIRVGSSAAVAFYLCDKAEKQLTAGHVVRAIVFQLCAQDTQFFECAFPVLQNISNNAMSAQALWKELVVNSIPRIKDFQGFIVLDGLDLMSTRELANLYDIVSDSGSASHALRFLLTGNDICFSTIADRVFGPVLRLSLDHAYPNVDDIALITDAYLADCALFSRKTGSAELLEYRSNVRERLVKMVSGDYYILYSCIRNMRRALSQSEVEEVLRTSNGKRQVMIQRNLSSLTKRLSSEQLLQLRDTLHLLAVLDRLGLAMPHLSVVEWFLTKDGIPFALDKPAVQSVYSSLLKLDERNHLDLATPEINDYLLIDPCSTEAASAQSLMRSGRNGQLEAIQRYLTATFTREALDAQGFTNEFVQAKYDAFNMSQFTIDCDRALAETMNRLIQRLTDFDYRYEHADAVFALVRGLLPSAALRLHVVATEDDLKVKIGANFARVFLAPEVLDKLFPFEAQEQTRATWITNHQHFDAVFALLKHPGVTQNLDSCAPTSSLGSDLGDIDSVIDLKDVMNMTVARRWLQSKSFWTYGEIKLMFEWFTTVPELSLEKQGAKDPRFDETRTLGCFTPSNWRKIRTWFTAKTQDLDAADLDIQTAAILCAFGDKSGAPVQLLGPYAKTDWRAAVWLAEAISMENRLVQAYNQVYQSIELMLLQRPALQPMTKAIDAMFEWIGHWLDIYEDMRIREKAIELDISRPGTLSHKMISETLEVAVRTKGVDGGYSFFESFYRSGKLILLETFVRQASHNFMHVALSRTIANDEDGTRISTLTDAYQSSIALCRGMNTLSEKEKIVTRLRLGFWSGRLHFLHSKYSRLVEAISIWEDVIKGFLHCPAVGDVEIMLPIITHLCSAYIRQALGTAHSLDLDAIEAKIRNLLEVTNFSKDSLTLKLHFRVSLSLAKIHVVRGDNEKALKVLEDHTTSALAMIAQRDNKPLSSIGWLYLASMLTILGHSRAAWAWSKVQLHQKDRWTGFRGYAEASACNSGALLDNSMHEKLENIKKGEEYEFWDGHNVNSISATFPDDHYLPSYASMTCDGRQCFSTSEHEATETNCEPLQIPAQYNALSGRFPPAQGGYRGNWPRKTFWVCSDCVATKLCITCYELMNQGKLPLMGCHADHGGVLVEGSDESGVPYEVSDQDLTIADGLLSSLGEKPV